MASILSWKRFSSLLVPTFALIVLVNEVLNTAVYNEQDLREMREAAVALAAQGQFDVALEQLRAMSEIAPRDREVWGDYLTVLVRADKPNDALALFKENPTRALPDYALAELFSAAVAQEDLQLARQLANLEIAQSDDWAQVALARTAVLLDAGYGKANIEIAKKVEPSEEQQAEPAVVALKEETAIPQLPETIANTSIATNPLLTPTAVAPTRRVPDTQPLPAASSSNIPTSTTVIPPTAPDIATSTQARSFDVDTPEANSNSSVPDNKALTAEQARFAVRAAEMAPVIERIVAANKALAALDSYAAVLATQTSSDEEIRNEKLDRVRALTLADRGKEAALLFESLGEPEVLPVFGLLNGADLYTRLEQHQKAQHILDIAHQREPLNRNILLAQYYLQLNNADFPAVQQTLVKLRKAATNPVDQRADRLLSAQLAAYSNRLELAQNELGALQAEEPDAVDVQLRLAQLYRWRGWPRRALAEYEKTERLVSDPTSVQLGKVAALVDMNSFSEATNIITSLTAGGSQNPELAVALAEQAARNQWQYSSQVLVAQSGSNPVSGTGSIAVEQRLISGPFAEHFRAFAHHHYDWAKFPEGNGAINRTGLGVDYRSAIMDAALELNQNTLGDALGMNLSSEWHIDDQFSVFGTAQKDSSVTPLRGLRSSVDGHAFSVGSRYRPDESSLSQFVYSSSKLTDGNERQAASLSHQRIFFLPDSQQLRLIAQAYFSNNSIGEQASYFNPGREKVATITVEYTGLLSQGVNSIWSQRIAVGAGAYLQDAFANSSIWDFEYEQRLRFSPEFTLNYGLLYRNRVYSGQREGYSAIFSGVNWRF